MLSYRAALPLSSRTLTYVSEIIRRHSATPACDAIPVPSPVTRRPAPGKPPSQTRHLSGGRGSVQACQSPQPAPAA